MENLSGTEAASLYLEQQRTTMNVGGLFIFDTTTIPINKTAIDHQNHPPASLKKLSITALRRHIYTRIHLFNAFRKRLIESPSRLGKPIWIEDPHFDLHYHVQELKKSDISTLNTKADLHTLVAKKLSIPIDRGSPLWQLYFIDHLEQIPDFGPQHYAIIAVAHHATIDSISSIELLNILLDQHPSGPIYKPDTKWQPEALPTHNELLAKVQEELTALPKQLHRLFQQSRQLLTHRYLTRHHQKHSVKPPKLFTAPRTPFNARITKERSFSGVQFKRSQISAIKQRTPHIAIKTILLGICTGALRHYLLREHQLSNEDLIALIPTTCRDEHNQTPLKQSSKMLIVLPTTDGSPINRLHKIHQYLHTSAQTQAVTPEKISDQIPYATGTALTRAYNAMKLSRLHKPPFNLVIHDMAGPETTLYLKGAALTEVITSAPVYDGMGLCLTLLNHNHQLTIGITSSVNLLPNATQFAHDIRYAFDELDAASQRAPILNATKGIAADEST
jgi:diacylglycerol O-acyltransferase